MKIPILENSDIKDRRVLVRLDFDFLFEKNFKSGKNNRFDLVSPTIMHLLEGNAKIIIAPSFQPAGKPNKNEYSVEQYAKYICNLYRCDTYLTEQCVGNVPIKLSHDMKPGSILFLENLYSSEEELNGQSEFAEKLSKLCDIYVNEAITLSDRHLASNTEILDFIERENIFIGNHFHDLYSSIKKILNGEEPLALCMSSKDLPGSITIAENLIERTNKIFLFGEISNLYCVAIGTAPNINYPKHILNRIVKLDESAKARDIDIFRMVDYYVEDKKKKSVLKKDGPFDGKHKFLDIGDETGEIYGDALSHTGLLLWLGEIPVNKESELIFGSAKIFDTINKNKVYTIGLEQGYETPYLKRNPEDGLFKFYTNCYSIFVKFITGEKLQSIEKLEAIFR